ncbi:glycosyltransferase family 4 protein [Actinophytocola glycyrrhizae]|uniref:Glycosyltransferase family 4 protein n=1 Tax=Actinophytocola glycyrrhizae TaxID=2044873 RepID=A0ABV9RRS6_9PSEU
MRVVVVNWRDLGHRQAGGAETYAAGIAHAMAARGHDVTYLTARDAGQRRRDTDGPVTVRRRGGRWTVYPLALLWLLLRRRRVGMVVDCQNGIPFFTPLAVGGARVVQVVHHVHTDQFGVHFPAWLAALGRLLEGPVARRVYRNATTVAVSPSTVDAMRLRLGWRGPVHVVPNGNTTAPPGLPPRDPAPTVVCLGRLVPQKRVDRLVDAVARLLPQLPDLRLHVIGGGPEHAALLARAAPLGAAVVVHGRVSEAEKSALLGRAWLNVTLSDGEGWGLAVLEAAAHGVPTLCRDVPGLRDSVRHGATGWHLPPGAPVADALRRVLADLADPVAAARTAEHCRDWAARFDWAATGARFAEVAERHAREGVRGGWLPGMPEATVAEFTPSDEPALLVEQCAPAELLDELRAAGARHVTVRAASATERLLGRAIPADTHDRPHSRS